MNLKKQRKYNDCGPVCFANALNILGYNISLTHADKVCGLKKQGTFEEDLIRAFYRFGFYGSCYEFFKGYKAWDWLKKESKKAIPIIVSVDGDSHWTLILMASKNTAQILDPTVGVPEKIKRQDFLKDWGYFEEEHKHLVFFAMSFIPFKKKSLAMVSMRKKFLETLL